MVMTEGNTLLDITHRPPELGRIRLGFKQQMQNGKSRPAKLDTFRLTSASRKTLEAAASLYGGTVREWKDAPDEGMWELITTVAEIDVLIPGYLGVISQAYELWQGGTCERRCDGTTEVLSGHSCLCAPDVAKGAERTCDIVTRLNVMLPRVPGLGFWRLDTGGWQAATTLPSTIKLLAQLSPGAWIPAVLRAEQRSKRERMPDGKVQTHRFVVPVLDLPGSTIAQVVELAGYPPAQLEPGERPTPPTAAERAAARAAQIEARVVSEERPPSDMPGATQPVVTEEVPGIDPDLDVREAMHKATVLSRMTQCEALPEPGNALGLSERCRREAGHPSQHKSKEGSW